MADYESGLVRSDGTKLQVGDRIIADNNRAEIKFIGAVPPTAGIWLGVEWDDPSRGKHDGSHAGHRYFHTRNAKSGSFIRAHKVKEGMTAFEAVKERYGLKNDEQAGVNTEELFVVDQYLNQTMVEMVGAKKVNQRQGEFHKLKRISLYRMDVYRAGPEKSLGQLCPNLTELDLATTLLSSWERVAEITCQMPHLKELVVSENRLQIPKDPGSLSGHFAKVINLSMNRMALSWKEILTCCSMFPVLEELHVGLNDISTLSDATHVFKRLRTLDLMTNCIADWAQVLKLGNLPQLKNLWISENQIKSVFFPDCKAEGKTNVFAHLRTIIIKRNEISEWSSVNELNKLQNLEELQIDNNPILNTYNPETIRQLLMAKIGNLKLISRTPIPYEERKGAEIDYLKRFGTEWKKEGGSCDTAQNKPSDLFVANHPRYQTLADKWGAPEDSEFAEKSTTLKDNLLAVKISSFKHPEKGILSKKLPATMTIEKLKTMIQRLFKMNSEPNLTYTSHKVTDGCPIELDNDMRQLGFFSLESGDTIRVAW